MLCARLPHPLRCLACPVLISYVLPTPCFVCCPFCSLSAICREQQSRAHPLIPISPPCPPLPPPAQCPLLSQSRYPLAPNLYRPPTAVALIAQRLERPALSSSIPLLVSPLRSAPAPCRPPFKGGAGLGRREGVIGVGGAGCLAVEMRVRFSLSAYQRIFLDYLPVPQEQ